MKTINGKTFKNDETILGNTADNLNAPHEQKIHLTMKTSFMASKDTDEQQLMHCKGDNIEIMIGSKINRIIKELFKCNKNSWNCGRS